MSAAFGPLFRAQKWYMLAARVRPPPHPVALLAVALFVRAAAQAAPPADYYATVEGSRGAELRAALHAIIAGHQVIPYSSASTNDRLHRIVLRCPPEMQMKPVPLLAIGCLPPGRQN